MVFKKGDQTWRMRKDRQQKQPRPPEEEIAKNNLKRGIFNIMSVVDDQFGPMFRDQAKCKICYDNHGWLSKCECPKDFP